MVILSKLKLLQKERGEDEAPFADHLEYMKWVDAVSPLLSFDAELKSKFDKRALSADVTFKIGSNKDSTGSKNATVGILNQAISMLEVQPIENTAPKPAANKAKDKKPPDGISLRHFIFGVSVIIFAAVFVWVIDHYFCLEL